MFGIEIIGSLLGLFPVTMELSKAYRKWNPEEASEIARSVAVTSTLFETTVRGFIRPSAISAQELRRLFPSQDPQQLVKQTLWEDPAVQQRLLAQLRPEKLPLMLDYLRGMHVLLEKVRCELTERCSGKASTDLAGLGMWSGSSYSGIPERLRDLRAVGSRLHSLLLDDSVPQISGNSWVQLNSADPESGHASNLSHGYEPRTTVRIDTGTNTALEGEIPSPKTTAPTLQLPVTDSGYESARAFACPPPGHCGGSIYTDDSITDGQSAQRYAVELANDMYQALQLEERKAEWLAISASAPRLLKAFAIKVGCHSKDPSMRSVMKFVHRHCRDILASIENILNPEEGHTALGNTHSENMSLLDKMALWAVKESSDTDHGDSHSSEELFEGVPEEGEEDLGFFDISSYKALIINSPPYQWLISALRHEMLLATLQSPEHRPESLREQILDKLPSGLLSRRTAPMLYHTTFEVIWNPLQTPYRAWLSDSSCTIFSGDLQSCVAESASNFVKRQWPLNNGRLLPMIQRLASSGMDSGCTVSDNLDEDTTATAWIENGKLRLAIRGPPYSVAENGEQLALLACGFSPSPFRRASRCTPFIRELAVSSDAKSSQIPTDPVTPQRNAFCVVDFKFDETDCAQSTVSKEWHSLLRRRVVVDWRSPSPLKASFSGLDASFDTLCALIGDGCVELANNRALLRGSGGLLTLEAYQDGRYLWRVLYDASMTFHQGRMDKSNSLWEQVKTKGFAESRHLILSQNITSPSQDACSASRSHATVGGPNSTDSTSADHHAESLNPTRDLFISDAAISTKESIDSDMLSISDRSCQIEPFRLDPAESNILCEVLHRLMEEWLGLRRTRPQVSEACSASSANFNASGEEPRSGQNTSAPEASGRSRKRQRTSTDLEDDNNDDEDNPPKPPFKNAGDCRAKAKLFACPYWKREPRKYRACFKHELKRVKDVKLHLMRRHRVSALSCQRCFEVFDTRTSYHSHVMGDERCIARPGRAADLIFPDQEERLRERSKPGQDAAEQWFAIWDILFPGFPHPSSAYMDLEQSREFCEWEEFCRQRGPAILSEEIERLLIHGNTTAEIIAELNEVVRAGFRSVFEEFRSDASQGSVYEPTPQLNPRGSSYAAAGRLGAVSLRSSEPPEFSADGSSDTPMESYSSSPIVPRSQLIQPDLAFPQNSLLTASGYAFLSTEPFEPTQDMAALFSSSASTQRDEPGIVTTGYPPEVFDLDGFPFGGEGIYPCSSRLPQIDEDLSQYD